MSKLTVQIFFEFLTLLSGMLLAFAARYDGLSNDLENNLNAISTQISLLFVLRASSESLIELPQKNSVVLSLEIVLELDYCRL